MQKTAIEWCDFTWNPVVGCSRGCKWCYARRLAKRQKHRCEKCYRFEPHLHPERLDEPLKRKTPTKIFVCSMGELFDPALSFAVARDVYAIAELCRQHLFMVLTKQSARARRFHDEWFADHPAVRNLWLGVSVTSQADANDRLPALQRCEAAVRFVSYEPVHGPVDFLGPTACAYPPSNPDVCRACEDWGLCHGDERKKAWLPAIDWLIIGAETGNRRGEVVPERWWILDAIRKARDADVPVFVKDNVAAHFPEFAGIREWPFSRRTLKEV